MTAEDIARQFVDLTIQNADALPVTERVWEIEGHGIAGHGNGVWHWLCQFQERDQLRLHETTTLRFHICGSKQERRVTRTK